MNDVTPTPAPVTVPPTDPPSDPLEGESLESIDTTGSLFEKEPTNVPHKDVQFKMDTKQLFRGMLIVLILAIFFMIIAFLLFRSEIERAGSLFV